MTEFDVLCDVAVCSQNCLECLVEGPGKCDRGKCKEKTAFDPDTKICKGIHTI